MFANRNNSKKSGLINKFTRKLKLAAAVAAVSLGFAATSDAAVDVTAITTSRFSTGVTTTHFNVSGEWATATPADTYTMQYLGNVEAITSVTAGSAIYTPTGMANAVVRRYLGPNTDILWYRSAPGVTNGPTPGSTQVLDSIEATSFEQAFSANNILVGTDNLFTNINNPANNNTNVERLDVIFTPGFNAEATKAFALFDRGATGQHDKVKLAAITGFDAGTGQPTSYGPLLTLNKGTWGNTDLTGTQEYVIVRRDNDIPSDPYHPSVWLYQGLGGVLIQTTDLVAAGTTIYGYSIFAGDVASADPDWTTYASSTQESNGGLDAIGTVALVYTAQIPEPSGLAVIGAGAGLLLNRRRGKKN